MNTELSSKYDPSAVEETAYQVWLDEKCFHADPAKPGEAYTIVIPPPNVTGALHLGHAINNTLQDILTRAHRMMGFNTLWVPGIDHAGIATQAVVEKQLKEQENKTRHDVGREGLIERIWQWKQQYGDRILSQLQRLGCSCDWDRTRFTLDEMCAKAVRETFFKLFKDGLIYRGKRLVNWDTFLQTSISDDEIYHETVKTSLWHIRYPIEGQTSGSDTGVPPVPGAQNIGEQHSSASTSNQHGRDARVTNDAAAPARGMGGSPMSSSPVGSAPRADSSHIGETVRSADPTTDAGNTGGHGRAAHATCMIVATTRPETMLGDTAVAVHSEDPRWNWAIGKHVRLPLTGRLIPIIADDILVDPKFGTGVVKVTPAHDPNDYAVWQRHKGQSDEIEIINILTADGKITSDRPEWSKYAGMKRAAARTAVVDDLKTAGLLEKEEPYETQVGHSDRSKTPVEPYLSDQWFVKMAPLAEPALEVVREGKIKFYPERHAQQYLAWLGEKRDWPVSRQLWWGHRIPVWRLPEQVGIPLDNKFWDRAEFLREWIAEGRVAAVLGGDLITIDNSSGGMVIRGHDDNDDFFICIRDGADIEVTNALESFGFIQDPDVLDTWFSSALWPHSTLGWPDKTPELAKYYPTSVLLTGRDIITLWVARMVMMGMYNMGERSQKPEAASQNKSGTGGPPVSFSAEEAEHGRAAHATASRAPSPPYSGERAGVRGGSSSRAGSESLSTPGPSPQPSPLGTGERESENHGRAARATEARTLGIPFLDVAINPTILDGKGERMAKSKGNGVDPVDIIFSHGADALRFTLTNMATETQDARMPVQVVCPHCGERLPNPEVKEPGMTCGKCKKKLTRPVNNATGWPDAPLARMTSEKFDLGRNFCNKLWNACRFALSNLEAVGSALADAGFPRNAADVEPPPAQPASAKADPTENADASDEDLMRRAQQADQMAFARLYERYNAPVISYLSGVLGNVPELEPLRQEVFLRAYRFAATYRYPHKFSTWLFTIARNLALKAYRSGKTGPIRGIPGLNAEGFDLNGEPREIAARATDDPREREEIARVLEALSAMPEAEKEVVSLLPKLSAAEMERITGAKATAAMTLADQWIIARFHRAVNEANEALKAYRFDVYAKACYDFFWRDFCDWYVEAIKPAMKDPARAPQTGEVLAAVLDGALRLMHPMIPFITETIWWRLNDIRPVRGIPGLLECPPSKRLVLAQWPGAGNGAAFKTPGLRYSEDPDFRATDPGLRSTSDPASSEKVGHPHTGSNDAEAIFSRLQEVIVAIRTIRNDYQVNPRQLVKVSIKTPSDFAAHVERNREMVELLATCAIQAVGDAIGPVTNAVTAGAGGAEIFVEGLIDPNAEKVRLEKERDAKKKLIDSMKGRLSNESYIAKAPPKLVQETRQQLAAAEAELGKIEEALKKLG